VGEFEHVAVVIPMLNEKGSIASVVEEVTTQFPLVIVVDDGSTDDSADEAQAAGAFVLRHPFNLGQGAALQTGFAFALEDPAVAAIATFDADGQHSVDDLAAGVRLLRQSGADIVLGSRFLDERTSLPKAKAVVLRAAVAFTRWTTGLKVTDTHNGLRVLNRRAAALMKLRQNRMAHASEILSIVKREGLEFREVPTQITYTAYSRSKGQPLINGVNIIFDIFLR
jgi:polyprenyl-phospho-N-acetylgalactosaminyl synthase